MGTKLQKRQYFPGLENSLSDGRNSMFIKGIPAHRDLWTPEMLHCLVAFSNHTKQGYVAEHLQSPHFTDVLLHLAYLLCFLKQGEKKSRIALCSLVIPVSSCASSFSLTLPFLRTHLALFRIHFPWLLWNLLCLPSMVLCSCTWTLVTDSVFSNRFSGQWVLWNDNA